MVELHHIQHTHAKCFPLVVGALCLSLFCCALLCVHISFAIISKGKKELVAFIVLRMSCYCKCSVTLPVIVVFSDHTHLLFAIIWSCHILYKGNYHQLL